MGSTTLLLHAPSEFILATFQTVDFVDISISDVNTSLLLHDMKKWKQVTASFKSEGEAKQKVNHCLI